ncbi:PaaI family thioesterase [Gordonia zhaorongruii]|uniref:PaaI family thioesterase n=1 Tax=Gordonia zhaorongruii TaxID=2597659 RepID=UPI00104E0207|nr:PaaI family thioesterase [Gordonia zhaorongruii]
MTSAFTDPFGAFAVGRETDSPDDVMTQALGPRLSDHRGLIELPALAVLFDDLGGLPFFVQDPDSSSMQARLAMSMLERPAIDERLEATAALKMSSPGYGTTAVDITGNAGRMLCTGLARNVRVGRALVADVDGHLLPIPSTPDDMPAVNAPRNDLSGHEVIETITSGEHPIGPIADLLGAASIEFDDSGLTVEFTTSAWMGNIMGTMHGGVIAAIAAQACSFAAQSQMRPNADYQIVDFSIAFLRSPAVDGRTLRARANPVKLGKRLSIFDAELVDGDTVLARATADVRFDV